MDNVQNITELQIISITRDFLRELQAERALLANYTGCFFRARFRN